MSLNDSHVQNIKGREFVTFAGLLELAHGDDLTVIETELIQHPSKDNGQTAIAHAKVRTATGSFSGIGDASPVNTKPHMLPHSIRLAETRALVRALRWATNTGKAAIEELGRDETIANGHPTDNQVAKLDALLQNPALPVEDKQTVEQALPRMSETEAEGMIESLSAKVLPVEGSATPPTPVQELNTASGIEEPYSDEPAATAKQVALIRSTVTEHVDLLSDAESQHIQGLLSERLSKRQASDTLDYLLGKSSKDPVSNSWTKISQGLIAERRAARSPA